MVDDEVAAIVPKNDTEIETEPTIDGEVKNRKFRMTIEPTMMLLLLGTHANIIVQNNLFEERECLHSDLGKNKSVNCFNMTAAEQEIVQPAVADLQMIQNLIETFVPCMMALFLGPWSDINGRMPMFITAISGIVVSNCMYCVFSTMPNLPPITFLLCSIPIAISGGINTLYITSFCYIVDITDTNSRAFRLGVLYTFINFGTITGYVLSPILYEKSLTYVFCLSSFVSMAGLLYTYIFLKETVDIKKGANTKLFNIKLVKDLWQTVMKQRCGYLRCVIILSAVLLTLNLIIIFGDNSFMYLYLQKQFSWTLENYTLFRAYSTLLNAIIPLIGVYILNTKLKLPDMFISSAVTALGIVENIGLAYSVHGWQFYAMKAVGSIVNACQTLVRSQLSKSLPSEDIGKIYAFLSVVEGFGVLLYSPIYTKVYVTTIHNFANCFLFVSAIFGTFVFGLCITILFLLSRSTDDLLIEN